MPYFKSSKANIYYELHGSGSPLLLIAGMASDSKSWQFILKDLSQHFRVIIFDNRGCGRTSDYEGSFTLKNLATDAKELLEYLYIDQAHVLGHSMGGMIAQEMALAFPKKIDKLLLASSSPRLSEKAGKVLNGLYEEWMKGCDMADWFRELFQWLFTKEALSNKQFMDAAIIFALNYPYPQTLEGFEAQAKALSHFDASTRTPNIHHNTLIISGSEDILIPPQESENLINIGGKCDFIEIQHAAHSIHAEKPKEFAKAVMGFLL